MTNNQLPGFLRGISPSRMFWIFAAVHLTLWTVIATLTSPNAPLDVIEGYVWGREWLIGTYKHPPMQAWLLEGFAWFTGRAQWAHFLLSQLAVVVAFWAVWKTGLRILDAVPALLGVLLLEGVIYYNFASPEFNPDVLQLPFWALIGLFYHRAVKDNRILDWCLLGVWVAGGLYSKYSTVLLLVVLMLLTLVRPEGRRRMRGPGPYLAIAVASALFLPHVIWLFENNFLPFTYAESRLRHPTPPGIIRSAIIVPSLFLSSQLLAVLPALLVLIAFVGRRVRVPKNDLRGFDRMFLASVTFGPCVLILIMAMIFGYNVHDMWGTPFWNFIGLWAMTYFQPVSSPEAVGRFIYSTAVLFVVGLVVFIGSNTLYPYVLGKSQRVHFPGQTLADKTVYGWHRITHAPLHYVIGDTWPAGNLAYYAPERPHVLINGDFSISPWVTPDDIKQYGGIFVWCISHCNNSPGNTSRIPTFLRDHPNAKVQVPLTLPRQTGAKLPPAIIGWAILPPA
jgi:4-amino-4-deoxy-L-arabinose transferase-like glycosyltransferase